MLKILYEDNHLIAVEKPAGLLVQKAKLGDHSLIEEVMEYIKKKYNKPGDVYAVPVHRLDRNVSGIVLFARTSKGAARLAEQFRSRKVKKTYHALVDGEVTKGQSLVHHLKKDEVEMKAVVSEEPFDGSQEVRLSFEVLKHTPKRSLLKINLETGKFHQIRAQLAAIGHPIVGDAKYGSKSYISGNDLGLRATGLSFQTATQPKTVELEVAVPKGWNL